MIVCFFKIDHSDVNLLNSEFVNNSAVKTFQEPTQVTKKEKKTFKRRNSDEMNQGYLQLSYLE